MSDNIRELIQDLNNREDACRLPVVTGTPHDTRKRLLAKAFAYGHASQMLSDALEREESEKSELSLAIREYTSRSDRTRRFAEMAS